MHMLPFPPSEAGIANRSSQVFDVGLGSGPESCSTMLQPATNRSELALKVKPF